MRAENPLRRRLVTAFVLLAMSSAGVFALPPTSHRGGRVRTVDVRLSVPPTAHARQTRAADPPLADLRSGHARRSGGVAQLESGLHEVELAAVTARADRRQPDNVTRSSTNHRLESLENSLRGLVGRFLSECARPGRRARIVSRSSPRSRTRRDGEAGDLHAHPYLRARATISVFARAFDARLELRDFLTRERLFRRRESRAPHAPYSRLGAAYLRTPGSGRPDLRAVAERIRRRLPTRGCE